MLLGAEINGMPVVVFLMNRESDCAFDNCPNSARFSISVPGHPEYPSAMICNSHVHAIRNGNVELTNES